MASRRGVYYFSTSGRAFYSEGGLCPATSHDSRLVGFVDQVVMAQADVDVHAGTSTWVEGGDTWCLDRYDFDLFLDHLDPCDRGGPAGRATDEARDRCCVTRHGGCRRGSRLCRSRS